MLYKVDIIISDIFSHFISSSFYSDCLLDIIYNLAGYISKHFFITSLYWWFYMSS